MGLVKAYSGTQVGWVGQKCDEFERAYIMGALLLLFFKFYNTKLIDIMPRLLSL